MNLGATVHYTREGEDGERQAYAQLVLAAVGRDPVTDFDWLEAVDVALDDRGFVVTDPRGRTSVPDVWRWVISPPVTRWRTARSNRVLWWPNP